MSIMLFKCNFAHISCKKKTLCKTITTNLLQQPQIKNKRQKYVKKTSRALLRAPWETAVLNGQKNKIKY